MHQALKTVPAILFALLITACGGGGGGEADQPKARPELPTEHLISNNQAPKKLDSNVIQLVDDRVRAGGLEGEASTITLTLGRVGTDHLVVDWMMEAASIDRGLMENDSFVVFVGGENNSFQSYQFIMYPVRPRKTWEVGVNRTSGGRAQDLEITEWIWPSDTTSNGLRLSGQVAFKLPTGAQANGRIAAAWLVSNQQGGRDVAAIDPINLRDKDPSPSLFRPIDYSVLPEREAIVLESLKLSAAERAAAGESLGLLVASYHESLTKASEQFDLSQRAQQTKAAGQTMREEAGKLLEAHPWLMPALVQRMRASSADELTVEEALAPLSRGLFTVNLPLEAGQRLLQRGRVSDFVEVALGIARSVHAASPEEMPLLTNYFSGEVSRMALMQPDINNSGAEARRLTNAVAKLAPEDDPGLLRMRFHTAMARGGDVGIARELIKKLAETGALVGTLNEARAALESAHIQLQVRWVAALREAAESSGSLSDCYLAGFMLVDRMYRGSSDFHNTVHLMEVLGPPPEGVAEKVDLDFGIAREVTLAVLTIMAVDKGHEVIAKKLSETHFGNAPEGDDLLLRQSALISAIRVTWGNSVESRPWSWASQRWPVLVDLLEAHGRSELTAAFMIDLGSQALMHGDHTTAARLVERVERDHAAALTGDEQGQQRGTRLRRVKLAVWLLRDEGVMEATASLWQSFSPSEKAQFIQYAINDTGNSQQFGTGPRLLLSGHHASAIRLRNNLLEMLGTNEEETRFALSTIASFAATAVKLRVEEVADQWLEDFKDFVNVLGPEAERKFQEFLILEQTLVARAVSQGRMDDASALVTAWLNRNPGHDAAQFFSRLGDAIATSKKVEAQEMLDRAGESENLPTALIVTPVGSIEILLYADHAPNTVAHFIDLCRRGYYSGKLFHRVIPAFVSQAGTKSHHGSESLDFRIPLEAVRYHRRGTIAMAREGEQSAGGEAKDSASGDFYFTMTDTAAGHLDGAYAVFGRVISGMEVLDAIRLGTEIQEIVVAGAEEIPAPRRLPPIYRVPARGSGR